eukprot:scaffold20.g7860.t1
MRVVSLLPAATDTVVALGLSSYLVARSHECDAEGTAALPALTSSRVGDKLPVEEIDAVQSASVAALRELQQLGPALAVPLLEFGLSVYHLHLDRLISLRPDVILTCLQDAHGAVLSGGLLAAALTVTLGYEPRVVHYAAQTLEGVWQDIQAVADALGTAEQGRHVVAGLQQRLRVAADSCRGRGSLRVCCLQWPQPLMAAGGWVPQLIEMAGSHDVCGSAASGAAPVLSPAQLADAAPEVLIFAPCGLGLDAAERSARAVAVRLGSMWERLPAVRSERVAVVDGERVFSRPGPLLGPSMEVLVEALHPEAQRCHEGALWRTVQTAAAAAGADAPTARRLAGSAPSFSMGSDGDTMPPSPTAMDTPGCTAAATATTDSAHAQGKNRLRWTPELHAQFAGAVAALGGPLAATPKAILLRMAVPGLTIFHIKSHLQKFREAILGQGGAAAAAGGGKRERRARGRASARAGAPAGGGDAADVDEAAAEGAAEGRPLKHSCSIATQGSGGSQLLPELCGPSPLGPALWGEGPGREGELLPPEGLPDASAAAASAGAAACLAGGDGMAHCTAQQPSRASSLPAVQEAGCAAPPPTAPLPAEAPAGAGARAQGSASDCSRRQAGAAARLQEALHVQIDMQRQLSASLAAQRQMHQQLAANTLYIEALLRAEHAEKALAAATASVSSAGVPPPAPPPASAAPAPGSAAAQAVRKLERGTPLTKAELVALLAPGSPLTEEQKAQLLEAEQRVAAPPELPSGVSPAAPPALPSLLAPPPQRAPAGGGPGAGPSSEGALAGPAPAHGPSLAPPLSWDSSGARVDDLDLLRDPAALEAFLNAPLA